MNLFNSLFILLLLTAFGSSTVIYSLVSSFPQLNQLCCSWLSSYNAQRQYYLLQRKQQQQPNQLITGNHHSFTNNRRTIRLNFFIQTLSTNQFGLTCGNVFFINKYNYMQLFLLNFTLILLFYKKICL